MAVARKPSTVSTVKSNRIYRVLNSLSIIGVMIIASANSDFIIGFSIGIMLSFITEVMQAQKT